MGELVLNEAVYEKVILRELPAAQKWVWILTADVKDMHVRKAGGRYIPFLGVLAELVGRGVEVRLVHAKEPGPRFRKNFDRFPELVDSDGFDRVLCPRMHMKCILIDGKVAYVGSANLTGAGMGAKAPGRRNFEAGFLTRDPAAIAELVDFMDRFWVGEFCARCKLRAVCPDPIV